ncbi:HNH endonuclease [Marixanthomonas sp. SCSIO 43207]|uniref:HNH endonuclease n=1 Tax=Marixanthomonas sp. SCSIO 43207 TaxID=2779360 RepID=UPI001CA81E7E|nr:HNH endonuclease [Marixanthomonas sp. SCSIO 43207]UAB82066.1 HNH endonuclease [Marixanthomonas sp. SCSIO 43207]
MIPNLKGEVWKQYSNPSWRSNETFDISNYGRVKRYKYDPKGELLKTYILNGYEVFSTLKKNGKTSLTYIHRAVAQLFSEKIEGKDFVIHKDFNKKNNHITNLEYVDRKGLTEHNKNNPAVIKAKKEALTKPKYSKLTPEKVRLLKKKIFDPNRRTRLRLIAKQFGISEMQLYRIKSGKNWGHIDYE